MAGLQSRFDLMPEPTAARAGRRAVAEVLRNWSIPPYAADDAVLLVSELVSNAVRHAQQAAALGLELTLDGARLRVSLADSSPITPAPRRAARVDEGGRGIGIIDALSDGWGVEGHDGGKRVWFELDLARLAPTAAEQAGDEAWDASATDNDNDNDNDKAHAGALSAPTTRRQDV